MMPPFLKDLPQELVYGLLFAGVMILQYLIKRFGPQPEAAPPPRVEPDEEIAEPVAAAPALKPTDIRFGKPAARPMATRVARPCFARDALIGDRRAVQNAIVVATILGPCRADQPHENR